MEFTHVLAWLTLVVAFPLNVVAAYLLRKRSRSDRGLMVLRERYIISVITTAFVLLFALVFLNNDMAEPLLDLDMTKWITRLAVLVLALVLSVGWIRLYLALGRSNKKENP